MEPNFKLDNEKDDWLCHVERYWWSFGWLDYILVT